MKTTRSAGMLLLGIYLILVGLNAFIGFGQLAIVIPVLALVAGILIVLGR